MKNIKLIRVIKDYTQLKVQMETGINQSVLSKYEQGSMIPTGENLIILAKFYKTSVDFFARFNRRAAALPAQAIESIP